MQVDAGQDRVVVEHFLEVGHQPLRIHAVAVETAADVIVDASVRHAPQCERGGVPCLLTPLVAHAEEELQEHGLGKLRRTAEAAVSPV